MRTLKFLAVVVTLAFLPSACLAGVVYVKWDSPGTGSPPTYDGKTWSKAFHTVTAALNASTSGAEMWVAGDSAHPYLECITLKSGVPVYGGFKGTETTRDARDWTTNETVLDGQKLGTVVTATGAGAMTLDGFTIKNGSKTSGYGSGVYCTTGQLAISNCLITSNIRASSGGGVFNASTAVLTNCRIESNYATEGGGVYNYYGTLTMTNCQVENNHASSSGGALYGRVGTITIQNSRIGSNTAPACFFESAAAAQFAGCTFIRNEGSFSSYPQLPGAVCAQGNNLSIASSKFFGNIGYSGGAVCSGTATIQGSKFIGNLGYVGGAINVGSSSVIKNNVFAGNGGALGGTIYAGSSSVITNNTIVAGYGNLTAGGMNGGLVYIWGPGTFANNIVAFNNCGVWPNGSLTIKNNCMFNSVWDYYTGTSPGIGDFRSDPMLICGKYGRIHLLPGSPCVNAGDDSVVLAGDTDIDGQPRSVGQVDIGADEFDGTSWSDQPIVVRVAPTGNDVNDGSSWDKAKKTIQGAVDWLLDAGGEVWVKEGTYGESVTLYPFIYLYGGFRGDETQKSQRDWKAHETIIEPSTNVEAVKALGGNEYSAIDGFTVRKGKGVLCNCAGPDIRNNIITQSSSWAISCNTRSDSRIACNAIYGNAGGVYATARSNPTVTGNVIRDNTQSGVYTGDGFTTVTNNIITGNSFTYDGGGIKLYDGIIADNLIVGNTCSGHGGGISGGGTFVNNTIAGNTATGLGGGIWGGKVVKNNIVVFNSSGICQESSGGTLQYNDVFGNTGYQYLYVTPGTGSISVDPRFVGGDDYHLQAISPCIEAGDNSVVGADWTDMDGHSRIQGLKVDMGAYEFPEPPGKTKARPAGVTLRLGDAMAVTAVFGDEFYVETDDRASGMLISKLGHGMTVGKRANIVGALDVADNGEKELVASEVTENGSGTVLSILAINRNLGGGSFVYDSATGAGQQGITEYRLKDTGGQWERQLVPEEGLNNIGLLITAFGRVTYSDIGYFYMDDGSALDDDSGHIGVKVLGTVPVQEGEDPVGKYVKVTGISSCYKVGDDLRRQVRSREVEIIP